MSTCITEGCGWQHGLVYGKCETCRMRADGWVPAARLAAVEAENDSLRRRLGGPEPKPEPDVETRIDIEGLAEDVIGAVKTAARLWKGLR